MLLLELMKYKAIQIDAETEKKLLNDLMDTVMKYPAADSPPFMFLDQLVPVNSMHIILGQQRADWERKVSNLVLQLRRIHLKDAKCKSKEELEKLEKLFRKSEQAEPEKTGKS